MKYIQYKEIKARGTFDFPLEYYYVRPSHPRYEMSYHWHPEYEIIRILQGSFLFHLGSSDINATVGDILFIQDGLLHGGTPTDCLYECIVFDIRLLMLENPTAQKYMQEITGHQLYIQPHFLPHNQPVHDTVWSVFDALQKKEPGYEFLVLGGLYRFFGLVLQQQLFSRYVALSGKNQTHIKQLKQALSLIDASFGEPISLADLSKAAGMSPKYFCRFFQEMTHRTPIDYLNYYRIERACIQLITTNQSMTEIAFNCGFNDISYFIKTFRKYKNTTPKRYLQETF